MSRRLTIAVALLASSACDPCAGIAGCTVSPHVGATGRVLDENTGAPMRGIPMDFVRVGGAVLERDSVRTITDDDGLFSFDIPARSSGSVTAYIRVGIPDGKAYRVTDLELPTSGRGGEARVFSPWSTLPQVPDLAEIQIRGAPPMVASSVPIEFHQTGGPLLATSDGLFRDTTAGNGWVALFRNKVRVQDAGDVIGDLTVFLPPPFGTLVRRGVRVPATASFRPGLNIRPIAVGPALQYQIILKRRGLEAPVAGASVEFHRTGGISVIPADWAGTTGSVGLVTVPVRPIGSGVLVGDLRITPPTPWKSFERKSVSFATYDADGSPVYDRIEVGPGISSYAVLRVGTAPVKGVRVDFRQTSGAALGVAFITAVSNDTGYAWIAAPTTVEGEMVGDLTIRPPSPYRAFTVRNVTLQARDGDVPSSILGQWDVASPPAGSLVARP